MIGYFLGNIIFNQLNKNSNDQSRKSPVVYKEWEKLSVFAPLSVKEMTKAYNAVVKKKLIQKDNAVFSFDDYLIYDRVYTMHLHLPEKQKILQYLDGGGEFPGRYALTYIYQGTFTPPSYMEYVIGPLDRRDIDIQIVPVRNLSGSTFNKRPTGSHESALKSKLIRDEFKKLDPLLSESIDGLKYGYNRTLETGLHGSHAVLSTDDENERTTTIYLSLTTKLHTLDMLPVLAVLHHPGINASKWYIDNWYYYDQGPYHNASHLLDAYRNGELKVERLPRGYVQKILHKRNYLQNQSLPLRHKADIHPSITPGPKHPRYVIKGHTIEWMGWSFELSTNTYRGPSLFDIKFKGERIIFEHSLNDLNLIYSAASTGAGYTNIVMSDVEYTLGGRMTFIPGLDCPDFASIINSTFWHKDKGYAKPAFCVFEVDGQTPLWRHVGSVYAGLRDHFLAVRVPVNLGNYDYTLEYEFYLDGKMGTFVTSSGVVYTAHWYEGDGYLGDDKSSTPFGYRIVDHGIGSIHDHTFAFKIDFDIINESNTFEFVDWKSGTMKEAVQSQQNPPLTVPPYTFNSTRYVQRRPLGRESGFYVSNTPTFWTILNEDIVNRWGNSRGYTISHTQEFIDVLPHGHPGLTAFPHLKYSCAVTKRKDSEPFVSYSYYDLFSLNNPTENLDSFLNNETIINTDIVAWLNVHFFHLPTSEDVPMTTGVRKGFVLKPFNFFDRTPIFDMPQYTDFRNNSILNQDFVVDVDNYG